MTGRSAMPSVLLSTRSRRRSAKTLRDRLPDHRIESPGRRFPVATGPPIQTLGSGGAGKTKRGEPRTFARGGTGEAADAGAGSRTGSIGPGYWDPWSGFASSGWRCGLVTGLRPAPTDCRCHPRDCALLVDGRSGDGERFLQIGALMASSIRAAVAEEGAGVAEMGAILDFGCGCGRVARNWGSLEGPEVHGSDYNDELVSWCDANLPFLRAGRNELDPPPAMSPKASTWFMPSPSSATSASRFRAPGWRSSAACCGREGC